MKSLIGGLLNQGTTRINYAQPRNAFGLLNLDRGSSTAQMEAYGAVGTLFSIVDLLATSTSSIQWGLYKKPSPDQRRKYGPNQQDPRVPVLRHLALDVWNHPNDFCSPEEFRAATQQHKDLTGEAWWIIQKNQFDWPESLWNVRPDKMFPVPSKDNFLSGYYYLGPDGEKIPFELNEVIFMKLPNPLNPYRGLGPVQAILADLESVKASAEYNRNFFLNSAEPGGIIEYDERLEDIEFEDLQRRWQEQHRGVSNAHRVAIIEKGTWKDRSYSMKDMQFTELNNLSRDVIREAFKIHKHMLGQTDDVNRANADAADYTFAKRQQVPRLEAMKSKLNSEFLPMFGDSTENLEFDYENPVPEDRQEEDASLNLRSQAANRLIRVGFDPNEVLEAVGLPDMTYVNTPTPETPSNNDSGAVAGNSFKPLVQSGGLNGHRL